MPVSLKHANSKFVQCAIIAIICAAVSLSMLWTTMFNPMGINETIVNILASIIGIVLSLIMALEAKYHRTKANTED